MTDRVRTLTVLFEADTRDDDAEDIARLIRSIRHVAGVELGPIVSHNDWIVRREIRSEIGDQIWAIIAGNSGEPREDQS